MALNGKSALITGSTSGIGLAIAKGLAEVGCNVIITGFGDPAEINELTAALSRQHRIEATYMAADVSRPTEIRAMIARAIERFGAIEILVNNAGIQHIAQLEEFPEEQWDQILAVNLSAAFHATKAVLPIMKRLKWGRIINISSAHGLVASSGKCAYVAAKHGLIGLTKVTAVENGRFGITANAICPGFTQTPLAKKQVEVRAAQSGRSLRDEELQMLCEKQVIPAFTTAEQIADLTAFICSESASSLTGAALSIDGGWVAQ